MGKLGKVKGAYPQAPLTLTDTLRLEQYDQDNFGFVRFEVTKDQIVGTYFSARYAEALTPLTQQMDKFTIDLVQRTVTTTA